MATFELTAPDGGTYHVDAPDEHAAVDALGKMLGSGTKAQEVPAQAALTAFAKPEESKSVMQHVDDVVRTVANGLTFGLADRFAAGAGALTGIGGKSGDYSGNLGRERAKTDEFHADHPIMAPVIEGVSGLAVPVGAVGAAAKGATLGAKTLLATGSGGAIGALQGAAGSRDWTDLPQVAKDAAFGGGTGAALSIGIPGTAKLLGAGYQRLTNALTGRVGGMSRGAGAHMVKAVEADGPDAVRARLDQLGPDAMLADAGPALLGKAQGASLNSDEGRSVLHTALTDRNNATTARIQNDVDTALGPMPRGPNGELLPADPQSVTDAIIAHRSAVDSVNYPAALNNAPAVRIAPIMTDLIDRIEQAPHGSMEHRALTNLQEMLTRTERRPLLDASGFPQYDRLGNQRWQEVPVSHDDANVLHKVKGELDNVIEYDAPGLGVPAGALTRQQGALKQMRGAINDALEVQVPGYAAANDVSAALARRGEAVDRGAQLIGANKTSPPPTRFAAEFDALPQGEKIALAKGNRGNIDRILGQDGNDLAALKRNLQGEGGWNTANIATVHGQPAADELEATVARNTKFRDTHTKVVEGSQTDLRNAARKEMKPDPSTETPLVNPNMSLTGLLATGAKKGTLAVANALLRRDPTRHYGEVARALTLQGPARDARFNAIVDAINARKVNAASAPMVGNAGAVVAALLGNAEMDRHSRARAKQ